MEATIEGQGNMPEMSRTLQSFVRVSTLAILLACVSFLSSSPIASAQRIACDAMCCDCTGCDGACDSMGVCESDGFGSKCSICQKYKCFRNTLAENGITMQSNSTHFFMGVTDGGLERDFRYGSHSDYLINTDFGKLGLQEGLFLKMRVEQRYGESLAGATGAFLPSNVAADLPVSDSESIYLTNFLITQALSESFVVFAGKLDTLDGDTNAFASGRGIRQFSNLAFVGTPIALRTVPYATLGAGFAFLLDGTPLFSFTVLNPTNTSRTSGFSELFAEGVTLTGEMRLPTNFLDRPGHQLFGATWSSRDVISLGQDPRIVLPNVPIARQSDSWALYWNTDQYLVVDPTKAGRGWGYFARAGIADRDTNPISYFLSAGLGGSSTLAGRENDSFGIGYYFSGTSDQVGPVLQSVLGPVSDGQGAEMFYNIALTSFMTITPDLQIIDPARENVDTATVAGLRMNLVF